MYEALPHFCKKYRVLGHTASTCNKGTGHKRKRHYSKALVRSSCSSPPADTDAVEKQQPYSERPHDDPSIDPMTTEVAMSLEERHVSPRRKRTKLAKTGHSGAKQPTSQNVVHISNAHTTDVAPPRRQYFTYSKVALNTNIGQPGTKNPVAADFRHRRSSVDSATASSL
ncbi:hypothetical protein Peur_063884 [Populus x canadensis]